MEGGIGLPVSTGGPRLASAGSWEELGMPLAGHLPPA